MWKCASPQVLQFILGQLILFVLTKHLPPPISSLKCLWSISWNSMWKNKESFACTPGKYLFFIKNICEILQGKGLPLDALRGSNRCPLPAAVKPTHKPLSNLTPWILLLTTNRDIINILHLDGGNFSIENMFGFCCSEGKAIACVCIRKQQLGLEMQLSARP